MSAKKQFTPEEIRHLRANPYTRCVTADMISYTLAFKEAFWTLSLQGYTGPAAFRKLGYNTEVLGLSGFTTPPKRHSAGSQVSGRAAWRAPGAACACKGRQHRRTLRLAKLPDGCGGRSCASSSRWRF